MNSASNEAKTISCPKGTYAVYYEDLVISIILIGSFGVDNATSIVDAINRVLSNNRTCAWKYCIYVSRKTISTPDAESKFKEFLRFRKWLNSLMENSCKVAMVFDENSTAVSRHQIQKIFSESQIDFKVSDTKDLAYDWLGLTTKGIGQC